MRKTQRPPGSTPPPGLGSDLLDRIAELIGEEAALRLSVQFGGLQLYIPTTSRLKEAAELVRTIGDVAARTLARQFGGTTMMVPIGRRAHILQLAKRGEKRHEIASLVGCTERYVYKVLNEYREAGGSIQPGPRRKPTRRRRRKKRSERQQRPIGPAAQTSLFDQED